MIYTVKLNEGLSVTIGRSGESDLPVKSSTVSRKHCLLFYSHKQLYVKDLKSKYGTFLYHRNAQYDFTP
jgi:pSer/pThr/pTyr-binding forkhead associated (FHA) protein